MACETICTFFTFLRFFFQNPKKHDFLRFFSCCTRFPQQWSGLCLMLLNSVSSASISCRVGSITFKMYFLKSNYYYYYYYYYYHSGKWICVMDGQIAPKGMRHVQMMTCGACSNEHAFKMVFMAYMVMNE